MQSFNISHIVIKLLLALVCNLVPVGFNISHIVIKHGAEECLHPLVEVSIYPILLLNIWPDHRVFGREAVSIYPILLLNRLVAGLQIALYSFNISHIVIKPGRTFPVPRASPVSIYPILLLNLLARVCWRHVGSASIYPILLLNVIMWETSLIHLGGFNISHIVIKPDCRPHVQHWRIVSIYPMMLRSKLYISCALYL